MDMEGRMRNVENLLSRIDTKLDTALSGIQDHETRLRKLEGASGLKWDTLIRQIILAVVAVFIGWLIGK